MKGVLVAQMLAVTTSICATEVPDRYSAYVDQGNSGLGGGIDSQVGPDGAAAALGPLDWGGGIVQGTARAGASSLGVYATATAGSGSTIDLLRSGAGMRITDAYIAGNTQAVQAPLNVFIEGALGAQMSQPIQGFFGTYSTLYLQVVVSGADGFYSNTISFYQLSVGQYVGPYSQVILSADRQSSGALGGAPWGSSSFGWDTIAANVITEGLRLPVNQTFEIDISITATVQTVNNGLLSGVTAVADFAHTAGFASNSAVLGLPDGYRFDAPSVGIVDNVCTVGCVAAPVPEPAAGWLLVGGLLIVGWHTNRCRRGALRFALR